MKIFSTISLLWLWTTMYLVSCECMPDINGSTIFFNIKNVDNKQQILEIEAFTSEKARSIKTYPINEFICTVGQSGSHDYGEVENNIDYLCVKRFAKVYIDTSSRNTSLIIYAASNAEIHDYGNNARVIDVDYMGSHYYANSYYLRYVRPFLRTTGQIATIVGPIIAAVVGIPLFVCFMCKSQKRT